jgi:hypothetical protein
LDRKIPINVEDIHAIIGFVQDGMDSTKAFSIPSPISKEGVALEEKVDLCLKYSVEIKNLGYEITFINNLAISMVVPLVYKGVINPLER